MHLRLRSPLRWLARLPILLGLLVVAACARSEAADAQAQQTRAPSATGQQAVATFAGGCFWCMEPPFDRMDGVISTTSGYTGGRTANPTYKQVSAGGTGHAEVVRVVYDPSRVSYEQLLHVFWRNVDPLTANAQFCDRGDMYRTAIYVHGAEQRRAAEASKRSLEAAGRLPGRIVTEITDATTFYPAEEYHQDYYTKNPVRYKYYRTTCGRDRRLKQLWGAEAGAEAITR
ncbi:MAG: peptide-methionine (S)-S-oxide reductase MsrA [Gemmatimonadota bacterium]|nr:peptide-methionine (S)-S-oxide reductase MsrA [Gemmatimonadota bacterium]